MSQIWMIGTRAASQEDAALLVQFAQAGHARAQLLVFDVFGGQAMFA